MNAALDISRPMAPALVDPITALTDDKLLAPMLPGVHEGSWDGWLVIVRGLYGSPMTDEQAAVWRDLTGRETPSKPFRNAFFLVGRRGGKTQMAAALTLYETALRDWSGIASPGELIVGALIAADRRQAGQAMRYIRGGLEASPVLSAEIVKEGTEAIELANGTEITVMTCNHRSIRGRSFACVVGDELGHWHQEGASPDTEVIRAAEPALSLTNGLLLGISTPHRRDGVMYAKYKAHWSRDDAPSLIVQAPSRTLNANLPESVVTEALAEDEQAARAEYLAQWRDDLAGYVTRPVVEALVRPGVDELPSRGGVKYRGFVDVSGGASDAFTWSIAHTEDGVDVLDVVREVKPPFSPEAITIQCAQDMRRYGIRKITGDRYGAGWVTEQFKKAGLKYEPSALSRSEIYLEALPRLTSGKAQLLDNDRLVNQLCGLERRARSGGRDQVDHPRGGSDDVANAAMGALVLTPRSYTKVTW